MKNKIFYLLISFFFVSVLAINSQNRIVISDKDDQNADPSAVLDLISDNKGFLLPRMETVDRDNINDPAEGLIIYNKEKPCVEIFAGGEWHELWCTCTESSAPTAIFGDNIVCDGYPSILTVDGGSLGTGANWEWYSSSCGGTHEGSGESIVVEPEEDTYYFVRAEGDCYTTECVDFEIIALEENHTPTFTQLGPYCLSQQPDPLPAISDDGISGSWSPSTIDTETAGIFTYTFTPDNNNCAESTTMEIEIDGSCGEMYYTTPGTYEFEVPVGVTSISVALVGGGGGGCGHLGGGGGQADAVPGDSGGNSSFDGSVIAYGGEGGVVAFDEPTSAGGSHSGGDGGFDGGLGGNLYGGGGGGAATFTEDGGQGDPGADNSASTGGNGGDSGGQGGIAGYGRGGGGGGIHLIGTPNTGGNGGSWAAGTYGGGGGGSSVNAGGGGGGAGGGLVWKNNIDVNPGETYTVIVGEGGDSGASYASNGRGGAVRIIWGDGRSFPDNAK